VAVAVSVALSALTATAQDTSKKQATKPTPASQDSQAKALPWQTSWRLYVSELGKRLQTVTSPLLYVDDGFKNVFEGKVIEFDGIMPTGLKGEPEEDIPLEMGPRTLAVPAKLFSPLNGPEIVQASVRTLHLRFESSALDQWKSVQAGARVRFRATLRERNILLGTTQNGGVVILIARLAVPLRAN
jgi:hypothetical protein